MHCKTWMLLEVKIHGYCFPNEPNSKCVTMNFVRFLLIPFPWNLQLFFIYLFPWSYCFLRFVYLDRDLWSGSSQDAPRARGSSRIAWCWWIVGVRGLVRCTKFYCPRFLLKVSLPQCNPFALNVCTLIGLLLMLISTFILLQLLSPKCLGLVVAYWNKIQ